MDPNDKSGDEGTLIIPHNPERQPVEPPNDNIEPPSPPLSRNHTITPIAQEPIATPSAVPAEEPVAPPVHPANSNPNSWFQPDVGSLPSPPSSTALPNNSFANNVPSGSGEPVVSIIDPLAATLPPPPQAKKRGLKIALISLVVLVVIGGGLAAVYAAVILPNKPANVLKTALINSIQEPQTSTTGSVNFTPTSSDGVAYKLDFKTAEDSSAKAVDAQLNLTVSGISFPVETRYVKQNLYVKVGDLSSIVGLVNTFSPDVGGLTQSVSAALSNKWLVVDSTLIDENATAKCVTNLNWGLSKSDITLLETQYAQHPFTTIHSATAGSVNGVPAEKFVLSLDSSQLSRFSLADLSAVKALNKCSPSTTKATDTAIPMDGKTTTDALTVWVDKANKRIIQVAANASGSSKSDVSGTITVGFSYGNVLIAAPAKAEPAIQAFTDIENAAKANPNLANLLNGSDTNTTDSSSLDNTSLTQ
jgi:hypothetical protein